MYLISQWNNLIISKIVHSGGTRFLGNNVYLFNFYLNICLSIFDEVKQAWLGRMLKCQVGGGCVAVGAP